MREAAEENDAANTGLVHGKSSAWWPVLSTAAGAGWGVGIVLGGVVIAVAAVIVMVILYLAVKIASQATAAERAVDVIRRQTDELGGIAQINDSGVRILRAARALRKVAVGK